LSQPAASSAEQPALTLDRVNGMSAGDFARAFGRVFEHSPWIAERAFARRPFASVDALHRAMVEVVDGASAEEQLALLRAHPELAGREAQSGELTPESTNEQAKAGLTALTRAEMERIAALNARHAERFGFPFIIAARLNGKDRIFAELERRLALSPDAEQAACLAQVRLITRIRLDDLFGIGGTTGRLSTHVLDTVRGEPAAGVRVELYRILGDVRAHLASATTNADGRTDAPLVAGAAFAPGEYELVFAIGAHFRATGAAPGDRPFLDHVPVRVGIADARRHYHVPLLCSPWSYGTYRGS
jgi:2-oxo-4-hydroxy-4-carboxy-5-ureidoimidazoline decarboxylase